MADSYDDSGRPLLGEYDVEVSATSTGDDDDDEISPLIGVCPFILGNEFCERLAYYGLSTNLVVYFQQVLSLNTAEANLQVSIWSASCYVTPLIGAWLADSYWGRYKTIIIFSMIYLVGLLLLVATNLTFDLTSIGYTEIGFLLYLGLYTIALGTGGIKPNVSSFGADQFDETDPVQRKEKASFFNWFYLFINIGSLIATTVVVYIQQEVSWTIGFAIPAVCMFLATLIFYAGSARYIRVKAAESPIARVFRVLLAASRNRRPAGSSTPSTDGPASALPPHARGHAKGGMKHVKSYGWLDRASLDAGVSENASPPLQGAPSGSPVAAGAGASGGAGVGTGLGWRSGDFTREQVEEVRLVVRLFPMFIATCFYWAVYTQMQTFFVSQGLMLDARLTKDFYIPAASMSSLDTISVILLIPVYDQLLVPYLRKRDRKPTVLQRIGIGLILGSVAMVGAGVLEHFRLRAARRGDFTPDGNAVNLSIFWQSFQYTIVGASEVFASVGQLELFYDQAPDSMRSCCSAMQLLSTAMGGYMAGALIPLVNWASGTWGKEWIPDHLNHGRLDLFFYLIAGLNMLNFFYFLYVSVHFQYKDIKHGSFRASGETGEEDATEGGAYRAPSLPGRNDADIRKVFMIPTQRKHTRGLKERDPIRSLATQNYSPALPGQLR